MGMILPARRPPVDPLRRRFAPHAGFVYLKDHPHPGETLREDVLEPLGLAVGEAAKRLGVSRVTLSRVLNGRAGISPDLTVRLESAGVSTARFWINLQANYELSQALRRKQPLVKPLRAA